VHAGWERIFLIGCNDYNTGQPGILADWLLTVLDRPQANPQAQI
jgi:hypothetical protein